LLQHTAPVIKHQWIDNIVTALFYCECTLKCLITFCWCFWWTYRKILQFTRNVCSLLFNSLFTL